MAAGVGRRRDNQDRGRKRNLKACFVCFQDELNAQAAWQKGCPQKHPNHSDHPESSQGLFCPGSGQLCCEAYRYFLR